MHLKGGLIMTYFELFSFLIGVLSPMLVAVCYGIFYTINDEKEGEGV